MRQYILKESSRCAFISLISNKFLERHGECTYVVSVCTWRKTLYRSVKAHAIISDHLILQSSNVRFIFINVNSGKGKCNKDEGWGLP